ncbi:hypothetical protein SAMN04489761_3209 [Tenacibaculum sp. MAR_2009_124]|uniref:hypothetical protein n=1 Tax=Tenacibaculum sp. MAR_2009_124 TaxID=1250059 RepID=UPI000898BAB7|nr:hypothetical protein [Tenacibaculum sp. MAR_2009_124]SEC51778.1 hypothetical protein SAMN04489761_3209 [Tenacibaculum sp. MAR_2009_124]
MTLQEGEFISRKSSEEMWTPALLKNVEYGGFGGLLKGYGYGWTELLIHEGEWNPEIAVAWCAITTYITLSGIGIFRSLKMLPIMLFLILYKCL